MGDTNKLRSLINQCASKALHFYKIVWQYLWQNKPEELFHGENPFIVDAHYFFHQLTDTLIYLPHVNDLDSVLDNSDSRRIVMKSIEVLTFLTREKEFADFFRTEGINLFL